jgi:cysteine desulfurase / selenocysteine lyase
VPFDLTAVRRDTPGTDSIVHFDCATEALPPTPVIEAFQEPWCPGRGLEQGPHVAQRAQARQAIAELIGARADQIALTPSGSFGWIQAFLSTRIAPGSEILASKSEFETTCAALERTAPDREFKVRVIPTDDRGAVSVPGLADMLSPKVALICITHMPANAGTLNPLASISNLASEASVPWILDACQSLGQIPIDVSGLSCHFMVATGRKYLRGPSGTGFLYVSPHANAELTPYIDYGGFRTSRDGAVSYKSAARRCEICSLNHHALAALTAAARYAVKVDHIKAWEHIRHLAAFLASELASLGISVYNSGSPERSGIFSIGTGPLEARYIRGRLAKLGIVAGIARQSSAPYDDVRPQIDQLRISLHYYNTENEVSRLCIALRDVLAGR